MTPDYDHYADEFVDGCFQCDGEGFITGCSWDWQCDTYDPGEGTCLCMRPCDICNPAPREKVAYLPYSAVGSIKQRKKP